MTNHNSFKSHIIIAFGGWFRFRRGYKPHKIRCILNSLSESNCCKSPSSSPSAGLRFVTIQFFVTSSPGAQLELPPRVVSWICTNYANSAEITNRKMIFVLRCCCYCCCHCCCCQFSIFRCCQRKTKNRQKQTGKGVNFDCKLILMGCLLCSRSVQRTLRGMWRVGDWYYAMQPNNAPKIAWKCFWWWCASCYAKSKSN